MDGLQLANFANGQFDLQVVGVWEQNADNFILPSEINNILVQFVSSSANTSGGSLTVTFPTPFPNGVLGGFWSLISGTQGPAPPLPTYTPSLVTYTLSQATIYPAPSSLGASGAFSTSGIIFGY